MRKIYFSALAAIGLVSLASCSNDDDAALIGNDGFVTVNVALPENFATRYGEGAVAKKLSYAVYEAGTTNVIYATGKPEGYVEPTVVDNNHFTLRLPLASGRNYDFIFWADAQTGSPYTFDYSKQNVTIDYTDLSANNENRDAFFQAEKNVAVTSNTSIESTLRRPFGQLNVVTADYESYKSLVDAGNGASATEYLGETTVKVSEVYSTLNLFDGTASDDKELTFTGVPEVDKTLSINDKEYNYLSMNYILTGSVPETDNVQAAQKELKDVEIVINDANGKKINAYTLTAVPFQRNYRTNIFGDLLTSAVDIFITVEPGFYDPDHNVVQVADAAALTDALKSGKKVELLQDIVLSTPLNIDLAKSPAPVVIDGKGQSIKGAPFNIRNAESVSVSNVVFDGAKSANNNATSLIVGGTAPKDIIIKDCTFKNFQYESMQIVPKYSKDTPCNIEITGCTIESVKGAARVLHIQPTDNDALSAVNFKPENITINISNNKFINVGGTYGAILAFYIDPAKATMANNIVTGNLTTKTDKDFPADTSNANDVKDWKYFYCAAVSCGGPMDNFTYASADVIDAAFLIADDANWVKPSELK